MKCEQLKSKLGISRKFVNVTSVQLTLIDDKFPIYYYELLTEKKPHRQMTNTIHSKHFPVQGQQ